MKFWLEDPSVLYYNYLQFLPTLNMNRVQQLNAITLFCFYLIILFYIFNRNEYIHLPLIIICFIIILFYIYKYDNKGKYEDFIITKNGHIINEIPDIDTAYYDSNDKLKFSSQFSDKSKDFVNYDFNELLEYEKSVCRQPTKDNPFMNTPVTDFGKENIPVPCNSDDDDIKDKIERAFNTDIYRDLNDLFDVKNSQRVWYTVPNNAIPNDQEGFANWLYKTKNVCKTNQDSCFRYEDLRYKR